MMQNRRPWMLIAVTALLPAFAYAQETWAGWHAPEHRARAARTTWDSVYTPEQATRGESTYAKTCSRCHQAAMGGADEAPALTGSAFMGSWNGQSLYDLHDRVRTTMPTDTPGTYSRQEVSDVLAYMLKFNQFPAGAAELPTGDEELKAIMFVSTKP